MPVFKHLSSFDVARGVRAFLGVEAGVGRSVQPGMVQSEDGHGAARRTLPAPAVAAIEDSRKKLLDAIAEVSGGGEITFVHSYGNRGDDLIYAGTRQLLSGLQYRELSARKRLPETRGHTAIMSGGGDWCNAFHSFDPKVLQRLERRFENVIVMPTSFDPSVPLVKEVLENTKALVFTRERESYSRVRDLCNARLAHDTAFFFDYSPYLQKGKGILNAYRIDPETARAPDTAALLPPDNSDISMSCESLDEWLWTISRHELVRTDRAHVMIAAVLMGKSVEWRASNYFKVPALAEFSLKGFPMKRLEDWEAA